MFSSFLRYCCPNSLIGVICVRSMYVCTSMYFYSRHLYVMILSCLVKHLTKRGYQKLGRCSLAHTTGQQRWHIDPLTNTDYVQRLGRRQLLQASPGEDTTAASQKSTKGKSHAPWKVCSMPFGKAPVHTGRDRSRTAQCVQQRGAHTLGTNVLPAQSNQGTLTCFTSDGQKNFRTIYFPLPVLLCKKCDIFQDKEKTIVR